MKVPWAALAAAVIVLSAARVEAEGARAPASWAVVNSSHRGAVLDIAWDEARKLLLSVGEDGTLRVWNPSPPTLVRSLAVTHLKAQMLAVNPAQPQAAFVATDGISGFSIQAWDWETGRQLWRIPLKEEPLFLRYADTGETLLYGETQFGGPRIVNAADGTPLPVKSGTTGMAGFAELSRTGTTLMSYLLDGRIIYADTASGNVLQEFPALPWLTNMRITKDKRYLLGRTADRLACLDLLSGAPVLLVDGVHLVSADISASGEEIVGVSRDGAVTRWTRAGSSWRKEDIPRGDAWQPVLARFLSDGLFLAGKNGEIDETGSTGAETAFARDLLSRVSAIAVDGRVLALADTAGILVFDLAGEGGATETFHAASPFPGQLGLRFLSQTELLVWSAGDGPGLVGILDITRGKFRKIGAPGSTAFISVQPWEGRLYALERDGSLRVMTPSSSAVRHRALVPGAAAIAPLPDGSIAVGQGPENSLEGSLIRISKSGEIVALPTPNVYTYALHFDAGRDSLYSLGVDAEGFTNLVSSQGPGFQADTVIERAPGEFLSASLAFDRETGVLYSTVGRNRLIAWDGGARSELPHSARAAIAVAADAGMVAALNKDSSVTLWDSTGGDSEQLSLFADGGWAAVGSDGHVSCSPKDAGRVTVYGGSDTTPVSLAPSQERVQ